MLYSITAYFLRITNLMDKACQANTDVALSANNACYAGCLSRLAAFLIDVLLLSISGAALVALILGLYGNSWPLIGALFLLLPLTALFYFPLLESSHWQATVGKWLCGLRVTNSAGERLSFLHALGRGILTLFLLSVLNAFTYLTVFFSEKKQSLYDILSDCVVLKDAGPSPTKLHPAVLTLLQGILLGSVLVALIYAGEIRAYLARWDPTTDPASQPGYSDIKLIPSRP